MRHRSLFAFLLPAAVMFGGALPFPEGSPFVRTLDLFLAGPAVNDQRGFSIAMDGEWLAIGARLEEVSSIRNAGAVHLFRFEDGAWRTRKILTSSLPQEEGQFGYALSLRGNTLAVGAIGESAVHVFTEEDGLWTRAASREAPAGEKGFGRSVAIDGATLAVGAIDLAGGSPGAVYVYPGPSWNGPSLLAGDPAKPEERFGQSVAIRDNTLVAGAPGADSARGAVYVFERRRGRWMRTGPMAPHAAAFGDQLGFAVAIDGGEVAVGAPTADDDSGDDSGYAWVLRREGQAWSWRRLPGAEVAGGQLGYAVAIAGGRIAAGAPFGAHGLFGAVHVFNRTEDAWSEIEPLQAANGDPLDLAGDAVAVSGDRVVFGSALSDQGGDAAGSVSSFRCTPENGCQAEGDVVIVGEAAGERFGASVAADGDVIAVGVAPWESPFRGSVAVYRRVGKGWWRQEARLGSDQEGPGRFLRAAVAIHGDLLVVGDSSGDSSGDPPSNHKGVVYLFRRKAGKWGPTPDVRLSLGPGGKDGFGRSVATDGVLVVVGAFGAAYVFEEGPNKDWPGTALVSNTPTGIDYAASVAVGKVGAGNRIAVGAPWANEVHTFEQVGNDWMRTGGLLGGQETHDEIGAAVAIGDGILAVGAPGYGSNSGTVFLFEPDCGYQQLDEHLPAPLVEPIPNHSFGTAVALRDGYLAVGTLPLNGAPQAYLFPLVKTGVCRLPASVHDTPGARTPSDYEASVAIGEGFLVVARPGNNVGGQGTVFELQPNVEEEP